MISNFKQAIFESAKENAVNGEHLKIINNQLDDLHKRIERMELRISDLEERGEK